ncbi:medium-chain-fatty-acid-CoA ligase [Streptomyces bingchenggensis BCW-1]|uniref:Medium-chain-fatty-acid-CoA ligase n=1 Tax=Streptomyces bingchenggensis (strain BCW-1) TaxID=749414 RepID=D7C6R7_STRBB|nr:MULTISPECIES: long-chain-fatty-acid--CoA ligase [Streptomyces]ADI06284.1 medium-chain-fatty-acid-CoA ligase [Streptomyces bingchenggensis BCW-1]
MQQAVPEVPLTIPSMITSRAEKLFAGRPVVSRVGEGLHRSTWGEVVERARRLAGALRELGIRPGDRVATFAGSTHRHVETYLAVPSMGAVLHTVNTSLPAEQVAYIVDHADDSIVLCDRSLLSEWRLAEKQLSRPRRVIVLPDSTDTSRDGDALDYEALLAAAEPVETWPVLEESAPAHTSYTTGTTGRPKGVVFSHRSTVLQSFCTGLTDAEGLSSSETLLALVPLGLSQVGLPFAAALHGSALVLPGRDLTPAGVCELVEKERPTVAVGFGAALTGLLDHWRAQRPDLSSLKRMVCGGSPVARPISRAFDEEVGFPVVQVFGMTETSGHGSFSGLPAEVGERPTEETRGYYATSQGRPLPLVEMRIADDAGTEMARDGHTMGELQARGPWVAREYSREGAQPDKFMDGWLRTGDVAVIDELGYIRIVDRMKDLVKSDGEWISSLKLEEQLLNHPAVVEAAVVAVPDAKTGERPLACVVLRAEAGESVTGEQLREFLASRVAASWVPDTIEPVAALPKTSIGKIDKKTLRARYSEDTA